MATRILNCIGLRCPQPVMKMSAVLMEVKVGDILEVTADCPTFEEDVRKWCDRLKKTLLWVKNEGGLKKRIQVQI
jgi:tRNA 2-thiouridine synthesizing protein A